MELVKLFITIDEEHKTITLKPRTTMNNIFVRLFLSKGYTIKEK